MVYSAEFVLKIYAMLSKIKIFVYYFAGKPDFRLLKTIKNGCLTLKSIPRKIRSCKIFFLGLSICNCDLNKETHVKTVIEMNSQIRI